MAEEAGGDAGEQQDGFDFDDGVESSGEPGGEAPGGEEAGTTSETPPGDKGGEEGGDPPKKKVTFDPDQQEVFDQTVGPMRVRARQAEERADAAEARVRELEEQNQPKPGDRPTVPEMPDPGDLDYENKIKERDEAITAQANWDRDEKERSEAELETTRREQQEANDKALKTLQDFEKNADDLGITMDQVRQNFQTLADYKIPNAAVAYIIDEAAGPRIAQYLAQNPGEIEGLQGLNPQQVAVRIATQIAPKAQETAPRKDPPPPPAETFSGKAGADVDEGPEGATYE